MREMRYVKYVCQECGAEDTDKYFPNEAIMPYVICWSCHSGTGKNLDQMHNSGFGMKAQLEEAAIAA